MYRRAAIRECFEESGILLACTKGGVLRGDGNGMLQVPQEEKERARKDVHANRLKFAEWVDSMGGELDVGQYYSITLLSACTSTAMLLLPPPSFFPLNEL